MPHLTLEYSNNLPEPVDFRALFGRLNAAFAEMGPFRLADVKSRAIAHDQFFVGDGSPESIFVHLTVGILSGRDSALQKRIGARLLGILREAFARASAERQCAITVEVHEIRRETYCKVTNERGGPASPAGD
jgi:5-carboxymethyl-2-hydroxymuconate isomerase